MPISYVFELIDLDGTGSFNFFPLTFIPPTADISNYTGSPLPVYDGSYTVQLKQWTSTGIGWSSATVLISTTTITLPPMISKPQSGASYSRYINFTYTLPTPPRFSGYPVTLSLSNLTQSIWNASLISTTATSFVIDANNVSESGGSKVRNHSYPANSTLMLADGTYNLTLCYIDQANHPENCTRVTNFHIVQTAASILFSTPVDDGSTMYSSLTGVVLSYTIPAVPVDNSVTLNIMPAGISYPALPDDSFMLQSYTVPEYDTRMTDGITTFSLTYTPLDYPDLQLTSVAVAVIQRVTPVIEILDPDPDTRYVWAYDNVTVPILYIQGSKALPGSSVLSMYQEDRVRPQLVINMSEALDLDALTHSFDILIRPVLLIPEGMTILHGDGLVDGNYRFIASYQDLLGNPVRHSVAIENVIFSTTTLRPVIVLPNNGSYASVVQTILLQYTLPEDAWPETVVVQLTSVANDSKVITFHMHNTTAGDYEYIIDPTALSFGEGSWIDDIVFSWDTDATVIDSDTYLLTVSYRDYEHNPVNTSVPRTVIVKTSASAPDILPSSLTVIGTEQTFPLNISYELHETAQTVEVVFDQLDASLSTPTGFKLLEQDVNDTQTTVTVVLPVLLAPGSHSFQFPDDIIYGYYTVQPLNTLPDGTYRVTIRVIDLADNAASTTVIGIVIKVTAPPLPCSGSDSLSPYGLSFNDGWVPVLTIGGAVAGALFTLVWWLLKSHAYQEVAAGPLG